MKKLAAAVLAFSALAAGTALASGAPGDVPGAIVVADAAQCPAGTAASAAAYAWRNGRFVRVGWTCETIYDLNP